MCPTFPVLPIISPYCSELDSRKLFPITSYTFCEMKVLAKQGKNMPNNLLYSEMYLQAESMENTALPLGKHRFCLSDYI